VPGVILHGFQIGEAVGDIAALGAGALIADVGSGLGDFTDTVAALGDVDLVVNVDTALVHLAGALGRPVWTLLPFAPDWRWMLGRDDSPWYPTMRLFRQPAPGDWDGVFAAAVAALAEVVGT
jgi:ADP-heptose:LPS heptosyltransferase